MRLIDEDALYDAINKSELVLDFREVAILNDLIANAPTVQREGWVSVPIEPTIGMRMSAYWVEHHDIPPSKPTDNLRYEAIYKAMIQAAPKE